MSLADPRRDAPTFHRNIGPILEVLKPRISTTPGHALEIGSGSGQHVIAFAKAFPNLTWWPTEYAQENIASIDAWRETEGMANVQPANQLDASQTDWKMGVDGRPPNAIDAIFTANVIHISPWEVCTGIVQGAARHLTSGGSLFFYGPFIRADRVTAPSNTAFDQDLRSRNSLWGIRNLADVSAVATNAGFEEPKTTEMPANNLIVQFQKR